MDVKSVFLYGKIEEDVYVCQPPGFEDPDFPDRVYKVEKTLYGLHQAPRAWYETLSTYMLDNGFQRVKIDKTLFIKRLKGDILLVQVYVDDIIFGSTKKELCIAFEKLMHEKFLMSSMGKLTFFLGLQVKQKKDGIFISQDKYVAEILKKFRFTNVKTASTPMETPKPLLKDEDGKEVDVHMYRLMIASLMYLTSSRPDIMFAVCAYARYQVNPKVSHLHAVKRIFSLDRKSTTEDCNEKKLIQMVKIHTDKNVTDLLTKAFDATGVVKKINKEVQFHALVDGKKVIVSEASSLSPKTTAWNEFSSTIASAIICLATNKKFNFSKLIFESMVRNLDNMAGKFLMYPSEPVNVADEAVHKELGNRLVRATTTASSLEAEQDSGNITKAQSKVTPNEPGSQGTSLGGGPRGNTLRSDEDSMKLNELMELCTNLQSRVLDLEKTKTSQQIKIDSLERRSSDEEDLGEDGSKQGRISASDADDDITLVSPFIDEQDVKMLDKEEDVVKEVKEGVNVNEEVVEEVVEAINTAKLIVDAAQVSDAGVQVSDAGAAKIVSAAPTTTAATTVEEITLAQALQKMKSTTPKAKGVVIQEREQDQIRLDEETTLRLQAEFDEEERIAKEEAEKIENVNITLIETWDDIQEKINADHLLAERLQAEEQEELSMDERAKLLQ
ncbi:putative ribonuclease H-like domain-containing protein [Tanacetum coccineum]